MELLDLPLDVLQLIIEATIPGSIENLALTCSAIYNASWASNRLQRYNDLYRPYRRVDHSGKPETTIILHLLGKIADDPLISRSIVSANFHGEDDCDVDRGNVWTSSPALRKVY